MFNNIAEEMNAVNNVIGNRGVSIEAICRVQIDDRFFLLVELEIGSGNTQIERVIVIEISRALFLALQGRVDLCEVLINTLPVVPPGRTLELRCTFVIGNFAYIVFEIEGPNVADRLVIVRSDLCPII